MGFLSIFRRLLPQENHYFRLFARNIANIQEAASDLRKLLDAKTTSDRKILITRIEDAEHRGDQITHDIFSDLSKTLLTPIHREDIHALANEIDDVLDLIEDVALRTSLYEVTEFPPEFRDLTDTLLHAVQYLAVAVPMLGAMRNTKELLRMCEQIHTVENTGDDIYHNAIARLFHEEKNPIELIKLKEILSDIEEAIDKCENVANLMQRMVVKYS
jgi:predicted phosphate transport protein (TIGR00153 family)